MRVSNGGGDRDLLRCHSHRGDTESTTQKTVGDFEESVSDLFDLTSEYAIRAYLAQLVEHRPSWNSHVSKNESGIIYTVNSNLVTHILDHYTLGWLHLVLISNIIHAQLSDLDDERVYTLVFAIDNGLSKDDGVVCVAGSVGDPVLLGQRSGTVNHELLALVVVGGCGLHLRGVVSEAKLCEAKASHDL